MPQIACGWKGNDMPRIKSSWNTCRKCGGGYVPGGPD